MKMKKSQIKTILFWLIIGLIFLVLMLFIFWRANQEGTSSINAIKNSLF
ncbi:MAG: hypothetical protein QXR30_02760 [Candidatus Woesearchaeota archaeon]